jgi:predicted acetyltransferase
MNYRKANTFEISEIISLWHKSFGDLEENVSIFISHFGIEHCFVCANNRTIAAMAFALPTTLVFGSEFKVQSSNLKIQGSNLKSQYIYACATHPNYRKQGIMEKLLAKIYDDACNENIAGIFLHAAEQNLANYYQKLGFEDFFYRTIFFNHKEHKGCTKETKPFTSHHLPLTAHRIPHTAYLARRLQKLENYCFINWDEDFFKFLHETGTQFCEYEDAIFSFRIEENRMIIDELLGTRPDFDFLFESYLNITAIEINTPGKDTCFGQMKWCKSFHETISNGYYAFAMS